MKWPRLNRGPKNNKKYSNEKENILSDISLRWYIYRS